MIGAANQRTWERLCTEVLERPELVTDPRFVTNSDRLAHIAELEPILEAEFARADAATWIERCERAAVPCGPINDFGQAMRDPHYLARGMVQELEHPALGSMKTIGIPTVLAHAGRLAHARADGAAHRRVLRRFGVPADRIADMRARDRLTRAAGGQRSDNHNRQY